MSTKQIICELRDDLLYLAARLLEGSVTIYDDDAVNEVLSGYTDNPWAYSDGTPVGTEYLSDYPGNAIHYQAFKPPHRRFNANKTEEINS